LAPGTPVGIKVGVTFGNAGKGALGPVDIDGSDIIEPDEAEVATVWQSFDAKPVPSLTTSPLAVTIENSRDDFSSTGDITYTDPVIDLGPTKGTATVTYKAGEGRSSIANCARLVGVGVSKTECESQSFPVDDRTDDDGSL